jgi:protein TonB
VVQFSSPQTPAKQAPQTLEITLVNARSETPPVQPRVVAQQNLYGGGQENQGLASSPLPRTTAQTADEVVLDALRKRQAELEDEQNQLLTQLISTETTRRTPKPNPQTDHVPDAEPGDDELNQESVLLNAQISALKERVQRYNALPRRQFVGPSARESVYAAYLDAWRQKIEQIGTEHYPEQARGHTYGSLQLTVYIRADGSVERIEIDRPSTEPVLNLAAQRIVQLAAPFAPFPAELADQTSVLAITRTWNFVNEQLETSAP